MSRRTPRDTGKVALTLLVDPEIGDQLDQEAKRNFRTTAGQLAYIVHQWMEANLKAKGPE